MYLLNPWADECWWDESAWLHDWGWDTLLDQGFWDKLLQGLSGARGAWALVHGLERGCSWEPPPPPPLWKCEERREERELVPQPDIPRRKNCFNAFSFVKKKTTYKTFPDWLCSKPKPHQIQRTGSSSIYICICSGIMGNTTIWDFRTYKLMRKNVLLRNWHTYINIPERKRNDSKSENIPRLGSTLRLEFCSFESSFIWAEEKESAEVSFSVVGATCIFSKW